VRSRQPATPVGNPFLVAKRRPLVVGHRGVPRLHQENTLAGFRRAIALGIPAVELDVRLTADGRAVVLHDDDLRRLTGEAVRTSELTWDQLSRLRLRRTMPMGKGSDGAEVIARYDREEPIPLLAEVLAELGGKVAINVELKVDVPRWWPVEVGLVAARELAAAGAADHVIVTSFDPRKLGAARRVLGDLAVGFCFDETMLDVTTPVFAMPTRRRLLTRILDTHLIGRLLGTRVVGAEHTLIGARTVARLHRQGVAVGTHTLFPLGSTGKPIAPAAETEREVARLVALGVDWIESDDPERLLPLVERG